MDSESSELLAALKASRKTVAEFSRERGISPHRLYDLKRVEREKKSNSSGAFVLVGGTSKATVIVSEKVKIEIGIEQLSEVL